MSGIVAVGKGLFPGVVIEHAKQLGIEVARELGMGCAAAAAALAEFPLWAAVAHETEPLMKV